jgi:hypothetical protein
MARNAAMLFGRIAVERGHLTSDQLEALLQEQSQFVQGMQTVLLGDLCIRKGLLTSNQVRRILESQKGDPDRDRSAALGELAVRNGFATPEEVELALEAQKHPDGEDGKPVAKLGEILLAMGTLTSQKHRALLIAQGRLRDEDLQAGEELELETREIPVVEAPAGPPAGPQAWLIQESGEGTGQLFRIADRATIGRMPAHEVAVADMGASREHAVIEYAERERRHVLRDLDSRNGTFVNGVRVGGTLPLRTGDQVRIGETVLRYASCIDPAPAPPAGKAPPPAGPRRAWAELHPQRRGFLAAAAAGLAAPFLPWTRVAEQASTPGVKTVPGWIVLGLFAAAVALALLRDRARPLDRRPLLALLGLTTAAALAGVGQLAALALDPAAGAGLGILLAILAGLAGPVALWFTRAPQAPPAPPPAAPDAGVWARIRGTAVRAGETTVRLFRDLSGKKARERSRAADRLDELLERLGRAALAAGAAGPDAEAARKAEQGAADAKERFERAGKETSARSLVIARSDLKWAEARLQRALRKLGRHALDTSLPLEGEQAAVAEARALAAQFEEPGA